MLVTIPNLWRMFAIEVQTIWKKSSCFAGRCSSPQGEKVFPRKKVDVGSVCCDGAPAMLGARQGFTAQVKEANQQVIIQCLPPSGETCFSKVVARIQSCVIQVVNFIKSRSLNSRIFRGVCRF